MLTRIGLVTLTLTIKLCLDLPFMVAGWVLVPFLLLLEKDNHLPWWAEWCWGNRDHGNDGESFYERLHPTWPRFLRCWVWLAFRNPTFNWSKYILGLVSVGKIDYIGVPALNPDGSSPIGDAKGPGWSWIRMGWAWEFYYINDYHLFGRHLCWRFRAGWKLFGKAQGERCQFVFAFSPFKEYKGK